MKLSRGIRNNNPGNIRKSASRFKGEVENSQDTQFKEFESMAWGYRAMFLIIHNYDQLYGINTLNKIISRWAPAAENHTDEYIKVVAKRLERSPNCHINSLCRQTMTTMVGAMSWVENGVPPVEEQIERGWELFAAVHK